MADESGEKTEEPTSKRLDDARRKGQVWKSRDLTGVVSFTVAMAVLKGTWDLVQSRLKLLFDYGFDRVAHPVDLSHAVFESLFLGFVALMLASIPVALGAAVSGGLVEFLQVGALFSVEATMPKLEKLNPIAGLKNMVSKKQAVELLKSSLKLLITGDVVYGVVRDAIPMLIQTVKSDVNGLLVVLGELVYRVSERVILLFVVFAVFDVWFQRRAYMKDNMMTKDEVKREYKESEGDPHHKAKRKEMHHEILEGAMMEAVKDADVVVTNPDHVAVALKYDREKDPAPRVIAKGIDHKAEAIKALARTSGVAMMRNVPLAHSLLRVELNEEIPEALYDAVAEVLNFVYGLEGQAAGPVRAVS